MSTWIWIAICGAVFFLGLLLGDNLTEDNILKDNNEWERLIELFKNELNCIGRIDGKCEECIFDKRCIPHTLADYLLKNGVIVPPCKVGDTVWVVKDKKTITQYSVYRMIFTYSAFNYVILRGTNLNKHDEYACDFEDFGKSVFLTKEETEKALKGANI